MTLIQIRRLLIAALGVPSLTLGPAALRAQARAVAPPAAVAPAGLRLIPATDPHFLYEGRIDFSDAGAPVIIWQGSRIRLDFSGARLALVFADATGQNFFNVDVDGATEVVGVPAGKEARVEFGPRLGPGRHHLLIFKRSEAAAGLVRFRGVEVEPAAHVWIPTRAPYRLAMEFIGDSITVGACNEDGPADQWENRRTHDNALSYAALTAKAFGADYRNIAVSGMGIVTGWVPFTAAQIWDRLYPRPDSPVADLSAWRPDVVFINFGENDDSFTRAHGQSFPPGFTAGYVALIRAIRQAWPEAHIVLLRGGMYGGARSGPLREAWDAAVRELEATDPAVSHFVFTHWAKTHPRVADDRIMAGELTAWLRQQPFMRRYR